ncbi:MAG TPA: glutamate racemase [Terriglobales bacterium]|nr:glutamate racemase [Terriglobales bacterium]
MSPRPAIGVFDSGVGGLTVLKELVALVPAADYLYFGDTARLPYGSKSVETVARYAISAARFLEDKKIELLVVACNTASALALQEITAAVRVPVIGVIEPGADAAAAASRTRKAVVIGTEGTVSSHAYQRALAARGIEAREQACPLFVPLVEEGWTDHPVTEQVAHIYLDALFKNGPASADVMVLGCTHYPLLKPLLRRLAPPSVTIVDSAESTAQAVARSAAVSAAVAGASSLPPRGQDARATAGGTPALRFFSTDSVEKFRRLGERFLGHPVEDVARVDLDRLP